MWPNYAELISEMGKSAETYPWYDRKAYGNYLAQTYYYVRHSTRLLAYAAGLMKESDGAFHRRFLEHGAEEKGHEILLLNDLAALNLRVEDFPELPETRMFWEPQYAKILLKDPLALMGYVFALEAVAADQCPKMLKALTPHHPKEALSFVRVHGEDDPAHVAKAQALIASLPLERQRIVTENFVQSVRAFGYLVSGLENNLRKPLLKVG